jgi:small-conductance mechanosensitive channel
MVDLTILAEAAARDPLLGAFVLMATGALVSRLLFKQQPIWRAIVRVVFLILLTLLLLHNGIVPYEPLHSTGTPFHDVIVGTLKIAWWFWAAWFLVAFIRSVVVFEHRRHEGKLIQDLLSALIYLAATFAIIAYVFDLPVQGLLVTSGAIAIVLGLALQSTLNDVFSGLVLSLSRPYRPGDWINIEGGTEGHVIEINWRATHVLTSRRDLAIVPNSTIAKSKILNANFPSNVHGITIAVQLDSRTPPASGTNILELAVLNSRSILAMPRPTVRVTSIDASQTGYEVTFFVDQLDSATAAQNGSTPGRRSSRPRPRGRSRRHT